MSEEVRAEMVANVMEISVEVGHEVAAGDTLVLLESMKMEIPVLCEESGTVASIDVAVGDVIQAGDLIVTIS